MKQAEMDRIKKTGHGIEEHLKGEKVGGGLQEDDGCPIQTKYGGPGPGTGCDC